MKNNYSISIITVTLNAGEKLSILIESLRSQTDKDFEWIVADGGSTDSTLTLLEGAKDMNISISSQSDFGIYDAINRAIKIATGDYYVTIGADDYFFPNAIADYRKAIISSSADVITAGVIANDRLIEIKEGKSWLYGARAFVTSHSVGVLFKKNLHLTFGYYSNKLPILADSYFEKKIFQSGVNRYVASFTAGVFSVDGVSNRDILGSLLDGFHIQLITEKNKFLQILLFLLRLIKHYKKL
jgi:glycosyltransferase involved in cell wall biosynthesis